MRTALALAVALVVLTVDSPATADDAAPSPSPAPRVYIQLMGERKLCKPDASSPTLEVCRSLPPGRYLDEASWLELDARLRELEDTRTRLKAENNSLRGTMAGWQPGWRLLAVTLATGFAGGFAAYHYLAK